MSRSKIFNPRGGHFRPPHALAKMSSKSTDWFARTLSLFSFGISGFAAYVSWQANFNEDFDLRCDGRMEVASLIRDSDGKEVEIPWRCRVHNSGGTRLAFWRVAQRQYIREEVESLSKENGEPLELPISLEPKSGIAFVYYQKIAVAPEQASLWNEAALRLRQGKESRMEDALARLCIEFVASDSDAGSRDSNTQELIIGLGLSREKSWFLTVTLNLVDGERCEQLRSGLDL